MQVLDIFWASIGTYEFSDFKWLKLPLAHYWLNQILLENNSSTQQIVYKKSYNFNYTS